MDIRTAHWLLNPEDHKITFSTVTRQNTEENLVCKDFAVIMVKIHLFLGNGFVF